MNVRYLGANLVTWKRDRVLGWFRGKKCSGYGCKSKACHSFLSHAFKCRITYPFGVGQFDIYAYVGEGSGGKNKKTFQSNDQKVILKTFEHISFARCIFFIVQYVQSRHFSYVLMTTIRSDSDFPFSSLQQQIFRRMHFSITTKITSARTARRTRITFEAQGRI